MSPACAKTVRRGVVSIVHAACASAWCVLVGPRASREQVEGAAGVLIGYLVWDGVELLVDGSTTGPFFSMLAHHVGIIGLVFLNRRTTRFYYIFPVLYLGELSTVFLSLRVVYRTLGWQVRWNVAFALSFFVSRIVAYGGILLHLWHERVHLAVEPFEVKIAYATGVPALYALNLFWFYKIVRIALSGL